VDPVGRFTAQALPNLLAIDTSSPTGSVAAARGISVLAEARLDSGRRHGRDLVPAVERLLAEVGWRPSDLDAVAVGVGPGSYTGLRVGLTCARTLAFACDARLLGIGSLNALALNAPDDAPHVVTAVDAQRGNLYVAEFQRDATDRLVCTQPVQVLPAEAWIAGLAPDSWVTGDALKRYAEPVEARGCRLAEQDRWYPTGRGIALLGAGAAARGEFADLHQLTPLYLRRPAAVETWEARHRDAT